jgi:hypothetical protein
MKVEGLYLWRMRIDRYNNSRRDKIFAGSSGLLITTKGKLPESALKKGANL